MRKRIVFTSSLLDNKEMRWRRVWMAATSTACVLVLCITSIASAQLSSSPNYSVGEYFIGGGGELNSCGSAYCGKLTAGEIAAGNTAGNAFRAQAGFNTDRTPFLAFSVASTDTDIGTLSEFGTAHTTTTFAVKTYLASGYVVTVESNPPTSDGIAHQLNPLLSPTASAVGTEQFGINLVNNTVGCGSPANFGADPVQVPDNTFSFGTVNSGYDTCGLFKYVKGDTVAHSNKSSGETDYTISFIYNISNVTPEGLYTYTGTLVATSTY